MTDKRAEKLFKEILDKDAQTAGIFISMLCYKFMQQYKCTEKEFFKYLKNTLKIIRDIREDESN